MRETAYSDLKYLASELAHEYGSGVHIISEPYLLTLLARLCSPETIQPKINELMEGCYRSLLVRVINQEFPRLITTSDTRMISANDRGHYHGQVVDPNTRVVTVNIARAGTYPSHICYHMLNYLVEPRGVRQDHIIMNRITDERGRVTGAGLHGSKVGGTVDGRILLFPDPMGATASSMRQAIQYYREEVEGDPTKIITVHLIITPEYIRAMKENHPDVIIYAIRLDRGMSDATVLASPPGHRWDEERGLDDLHYIVPGGGGFGEVLNNAEV